MYDPEIVSLQPFGQSTMRRQSTELVIRANQTRKANQKFPRAPGSNLALPYKPDPDLGTLQIGGRKDRVSYQVDDRTQRAMKKRKEEARGND
jgi:hypothetical protein